MKFAKGFIVKYKLPLIIIGTGIAVMLLGSVLEKKEGDEHVSWENSTREASGGTSTVQNEFENYAIYEEKRIENLISKIDGAGTVKAAVYVNATPSGDDKGLVFPEIKGVLIYSSGASKNSVKEKIVRAVSSLYGISLSAVNVVF